MASISSIVLQPKHREYENDMGPYIREPLAVAKLIADHGIEGDRKARPNSKRQLNILSREWLAQLTPQGFKTAPGQFGEQIVVEGLAVEKLNVGDRLQLGDAACVEVTMPRTGCERLQAAQESNAEFLLGHVGVMARVVAGGTVRVGDPVRVWSVPATRCA
jgi:MOSC domain-containing protein YiiM